MLATTGSHVQHSVQRRHLIRILGNLSSIFVRRAQLWPMCLIKIFYRATKYFSRLHVCCVAGHQGQNTAREIAYREADVILLCYKVTDIASLFSAVHHWVPDLRARAPVTPIVLVGLCADLRGDRAALHSLAKLGRAPVSSEQARSFSQQVEAVSYVETSAKLSSKGPEAIFQLAAQISLEQVKAEAEYPSKPSPISTSTPSNSLERATESPESFWDQYQSPPLPRPHCHARSASLSSSLNSTRSSISLPVPRSPLTSRRNSVSLRSRPSGGQDKFIKIRCQRLNEHKIYEEVEIEVPAPIYETLQASNERSRVEMNGNLKRKESFGSKLKSLFLRD